MRVSFSPIRICVSDCVLQDPTRIIGCTGSPADSHEVHWFTVGRDRTRFCPECGSGWFVTNSTAMTLIYLRPVYALNYQGSEEEAAHHH